MSTRKPDRSVRPKPHTTLGMVPANDIDSYDAVPWFRKQWILGFAPALIVAALTGDVFVKATKKMQDHSEADVWRYTSGAKASFIVVGLIFVVVVIMSFFG